MGHILRTYVRNKSQFGICTMQLYVRRYTKRRQKAIRTYVHMYICTYTLVSTWASVCVMCVRTYACRQRGQTQPNQRRQSTYARTQIFLFPPKRPQLPGTRTKSAEPVQIEMFYTRAPRNPTYVHRNSNKCQFGIRNVQLCVRR